MYKALTLFTAIFIFIAGQAFAAPEIGKPAPEFTGMDSKGVTHKLSDLRGRTVVLEWTNHECPYVGKQYGSGNMQALQQEATDNGVIWMTIVSSAEGHQGYTTAEQAEEIMKATGSHATARILDPSGEIGGLYGAKTTPHMFVINPEGVLVYEGAIDSDNGFKEEGLVGATNYVREALNAVANGEEVEIASTKPYGCSVKY